MLFITRYYSFKTLKLQLTIISKHKYYLPINYWVVDVFYISLSNNDHYQLQPDGFSYILYSEENKIAYHKPFVSPLELKSSQFVVKCRPTYISYLQQNNIDIKANNHNEFLTQFNTPKLKNFEPSVLDYIIFHLHFLNEKNSLNQLCKRYQCNSLKIEKQFKCIIGLSFIQYQNTLIKLRRPTYSSYPLALIILFFLKT
ncbi:hypothetical protein BWZ22_11030 [Seonamhaeicola sp. S2-3]|uniref:hypothetical protein n=1 Tax=Seonamhaeicola sp. S2-3 TaxID=1936081 RepID=UPI00097284B8|nr:hypothetical protein [Seonamhaeicola sp. S2-3]APY11737.1 hypothetical protein BWZ22_11030 [Seonamhaeicola sp. S2-3]